MFSLLPQPYEGVFMTFFFVYVRISAAVLTMPILSGRSVPRPIKAGIAFWVAVAVMGPNLGLVENPTFHLPQVERVYNGVVDFALAVAGEAAIGMALGFIGQMLVFAVGLSGEIIGQQAGFSAASVFDPITGQDNFLMAQIKIWFATIIFIIIGGPESVLEFVWRSFELIRPGEGISLAQLGDSGKHILVVEDFPNQAMMSMMYIIGIRIAVPMIATMVLVSLAEAFIARTVPQMNIMSVGFAIRISMSLFFLGHLINYIVMAMSDHLHDYEFYASKFMERMISF